MGVYVSFLIFVLALSTGRAGAVPGEDAAPVDTVLSVEASPSADRAAERQGPVFELEWGSFGTGNGQFNEPRGIDVDAAGDVYVAEFGHNGPARLQKFDSHGNFLAELVTSGSADGQLFGAQGILVDPTGNIYVIDSGARIQKFDSRGNFLLKWGSSGRGQGQFNWAQYLDLDSAGNLYISDAYNFRVQKFDSNGAFLEQWGRGILDLPIGLAIDDADNIYVFSAYSGLIHKFDSNGSLLLEWSARGNDIAIDAVGDVYVADTDNHRVQKYNGNGVLLWDFGSLGAEPGQFSDPHGIAVDGAGNVYVADTDNHRVQKFSQAFPGVKVSLPALTATYNQALSIPVAIGDATGIVSGELTVEYDAALLTLVGADTKGALSDGWSVQSDTRAGAGTLRRLLITMATDQSAVTGAQTLVNLDFTVNDVRVPASSTLKVERCVLNGGHMPVRSVHGRLKLVGQIGRIRSDPGEFAPGADLAVFYADADADMDGAASSDRVEILASNSGNGDALLVELEEEAAGRFAGVVSTGYGAGAVNDDLLQVQAGDVAEFSVQDRLDKSGTSGLRVTQSAVVASEGGEVYLESLSEDDTPPSAHPAGNRVLHLDGRDSYVELPGGIFDGLTAATVEAWVRWDDWDSFSQWFAFGADGEWRAMGINHFDRTSILQFFIYPDKAPLRVLRAKSDLPLGQWCHMAAVSGPGGMRLYLNGMLLAHHGYEGSFAVVGEGWSNYLGKSNWAENRFFRGGLDEVRVWSSERSQAQIRTDMERRLRGDEVGLVGLWNFDDGAAADRSPAGHHGRLRGRARSVPAPFPGADAVVQPAVLRGVVRDENGMPLADARVRLKDADGDSLSILAWGDGHYGVVVLGSGTYALSVLPENELLPPREVSLQTGRTSFLNQRPAVDPVARWRAEGDADDGRGGHHGALLNGATFAPGLVGQAFHLDGVDDLIRVPHAPVLNPQGGFSLVAWIFPTADRAAYIYSKWGDADEWVDQRAYSLRTLPGLKLSFMISDNVLESDRPVPEFESSPNAIKLNTWNQVVAVYDHSAGARRIYVNGALVAQREDQPVNITRSIADLIIGTYLPAPHRNPSESFAGLIDEISIHDRTLTEIEIQRLYSAHAQARWSGEGNANDATRGGNDGALVKQVTFAPGVVGQAFAFDGQDGYVQLSSLIGHVGTADFTTEWWLWCAPQSPGEQPLLAKHLDENNALEVRLDEEKRVQVTLKGSGDIHLLSSNATLSEQNWYHLALVRRGGDLSLYVDSHLDTLHTTSHVADMSMTTPLMLGGGSEYERSFAGRIDEVAWHNRALSAEEILAIYESNMRTWYWTLWRGRLQKGGVGLVALLALLYGVRYYSQRRAREADHRAREVADAANAAKSAFLANMSHEIRTPMNAILGYAQILRNHPALPPDQRRAVEAIYTSGDHLLELVNDVLDLSKIEAGHMDLQPVDFDLGQLVEGLAIMFQLRCQQKDLSWSLEQEGEDWQVHGDQNKLRQVLVNLLGNAVKFTAEGEVELRVEAREGAYYFAVRDTGPGIPPEQREEIFIPFQQGVQGAHPMGTGLGLAIARRHVELMGGHLQVESPEERGARFFFLLSLPPAQSAVMSRSERHYSQVVHLAAGCSPQILIVDDIETNRAILVQILEGIGAGVRQAASGEEALAAVDEERPDLVFMDIRMPGMDGVETLNRLRQAHKALPVTALSASVMEHQKAYYLSVGFDAFIDKPFRIEALYACLEEILGVEYEYASPATATAPASVNFDGVRLPAPLRARLRQAVEMHNVTRIGQCLEQLQGLGDREKALALRLDALVQCLDMDTALRILERTVDG